MKTIEKLITHYLSFSEDVDCSRTVIDIGCGSGKTVFYLSEFVSNIFGTDIKFKHDDYGSQKELIDKKILRLIGRDGIFPFDNDFASMTFTDNVIEHVEDLDGFLKELSRISNKNSISLHYFPSSLKLIEPHVFIPGATKIRNLYFIKAWCRINKIILPNSKYSFDNPEKIQKYLLENTFYRNTKEIETIASRYFDQVYWDFDLLKYIDNKYSTIIYNLPMGPYFFNLLWSKLLILKSPKSNLK